MYTIIEPAALSVPANTRPAALPVDLRTVRGHIFDLQRASLHDGPGIRTTVFLKGCALRCAWCHNPESQRRAPELGYDAAKCLACRACAEICPEVHSFVDGIAGAAAHRVNFSACDACGECVPGCTADALRLYGRDVTVGEVMSEVVRDRAYFTRSGGGLTLSGGEPTTQLAFCVALLRAACEEGVHTCLETCGFSPRAAYAAVLPFTKYVLFDYKATGAPLHEALTGVRPERILENLRWLHDAGAAILLRCPLVPGVNDTDEHLRAIAALTHELPDLRGVEVLPYHESGVAKYDRIGRARPALAARVPEAADERRWHETLRAAGCRGLVGAH
ncbi:MAG TPA: glycyl-radical enzyme activating protein [Opitutaceae bacterium]